MKLVAPITATRLGPVAEAAHLAHARGVDLSWHFNRPDQVQLSGPEPAVLAVVQLLTVRRFLCSTFPGEC